MLETHLQTDFKETVSTEHAIIPEEDVKQKTWLKIINLLLRIGSRAVVYKEALDNSLNHISAQE